MHISRSWMTRIIMCSCSETVLIELLCCVHFRPKTNILCEAKWRKTWNVFFTVPIPFFWSKQFHIRMVFLCIHTSGASFSMEKWGYLALTDLNFSPSSYCSWHPCKAAGTLCPPLGWSNSVVSGNIQNARLCRNMTGWNERALVENVRCSNSEVRCRGENAEM